jgi:hypothetical protein
MSDTLMILPASDASAIRLVRVPDDFESHEAFRHVTGLIASVEEQDHQACLSLYEALQDQ